MKLTLSDQAALRFWGVCKSGAGSGINFSVESRNEAVCAEAEAPTGAVRRVVATMLSQLSGLIIYITYNSWWVLNFNWAALLASSLCEKNSSLVKSWLLWLSLSLWSSMSTTFLWLRSSKIFAKRTEYLLPGLKFSKLFHWIWLITFLKVTDWTVRWSRKFLVTYCNASKLG